MPDDAELLRRYAENRSEDAFAGLVRRYLNLVYFAALRRTGGDTHCAEDVAQQVFTALACNAPSLARRTVLTGWLYTTTRNIAAKALRADRRRKTREQEASAMHDFPVPSGQEADWEKLRPVLDGAMDELSDRDREAVLLRYFDNQPFAEIGAALSLSEDAARMRVDRALDKLRALLARRGITSTSDALATVLAGQSALATPAGLTASVTTTAMAGCTAAISGFSILQIMSTSKIAAGAAGVVLALAVGTAIHKVNVRREAEAALATARQENEALMEKLHGLQRRAETADQAAAALQKSIDNVRAASASAGTSGGSAVPVSERSFDESLAVGEAFMERHPDVKRAVLDLYHAQMAGQFGAFYKALGLTPEQIEIFENSMMHGAGVIRMVQGMDGKPFILSVSWGNADKRREEEDQLRALLDDSSIGQLREFIQQLPARNLTSKLAGALYFTPTPLTAEQADQFISIVADSRISPDKSSGNQFDWDAIIARAQDLLTEPQLAALGGIQAQEQFNQAMADASRYGASTQSGEP